MNYFSETSPHFGKDPFEKLVHFIELKRVRGDPWGHQFTPLLPQLLVNLCCSFQHSNLNLEIFDLGFKPLLLHYCLDGGYNSL
jgi:hypothetical protein